GSRLSTITEEPTDMTEGTLFRHYEPNWENYASLASFACLQCAQDGHEQTTSAADVVCEVVWLHVQDSPQYTVDVLDAHSVPQVVEYISQGEEPLDLYYTSDTSTLA
ncbi:MAG: hypothetical protein ACKPKO_58055, partial [Candidatus Fonsibacter sp.]